MSYLDMYQTSLQPAADKDIEQSQGDTEEDGASMTLAPVQARFRNQFLTTILSEEIASALTTTPAIDLAYNAIDQIPRTMSAMLIAVDLSYNSIERPIVLTSEFHLLELNMSNNKITELKGLALLVTLEYLDVSHNYLSRLEGLENMKGLKVLKLQYNKIATFQSLRLLTYNRMLNDVCMEGNPIVNDPYYKVKLLNSIPNLKYLEGTTIWRRTSLQSRIVNDDLKYADLCARTPTTVQKYANLSRRSHTHPDEHVLNNLSGSMLTMQSLRANNDSFTAAAAAATPSHGRHNDPHPHRALPEHTPLPRNLTNWSNIEANKEPNYSQNYSPKKCQSGEGEKSDDLGLLPAQLQATLQKHRRFHTSPRRASNPQQLLFSSSGAGQSPLRAATSAAQPWATATAGAAMVQAVHGGGRASYDGPIEAHPRPRSALPWRNPPSIVPNTDVHFKHHRSRGAGGSDADTTVSTPRAFGSSRVVSRPSSTTRTSQRLFDISSSSMTPQKINAVKPSSFPSSAVEPVWQEPTTSPVRAAPAPTSTANNGAACHWMNPELNSAIQTRANTPFDSKLMENAMSSSLFILQQSFDADKRMAGSSNGSVASSSATRARASSVRSGLSGSARGGSLRAVTPTKSSIKRANYTNEMIQSQQEAEQAAQALVDARSYPRTSPSRSPQRARNPAYTYLQGTSSPERRGDRSSGIASYSVRTQPFSPEPTRRPTTASSGYRSQSPYRDPRSGSPPRESSTARILDMYKDMPAHQEARGTQHAAESKHSLSIKVPQPSQKRRTRTPSPKLTVPVQDRLYAHSVSDESKERTERRATPPPPSQPHPDEESPYRRFLRLRERLSSKYVQSEAEHGEYFEPVRSDYGAGEGSGEKKSCEQIEPDEERSMFSSSVRSGAISIPVEVTEKLMPERRVERNLTAPTSIEETVTVTAGLPQDLQFDQLKEQFSRQYQQEYERQRRELDDLRARSSSPSTTTAAAPRTITPTRSRSPSLSLPAGSVVAPPAVPPRSSGYDQLYDLIHQRRAVLQRITQPSDLDMSPDKTRHKSPENVRIGGAINHLRERQAASVNVIQSATRERTVPVPIHNGLLQMSLSTPALYPSINEYAFMTQSHPSGESNPTSVQNSFMNRLTTNNPYMQTASALPPPATSDTDSRFERVTDLAQSYPAPPPYVPHIHAAGPQSSSGGGGEGDSGSRGVGTVSVGGRPIFGAPPASSGGVMASKSSSVDLAKAIRDLQAKQTKDLAALKTQ